MEQLKFHQEITFVVKGETLNYNVEGDHCAIKGGYPNDKIFHLLGLSEYEFASKAYGYKTKDGIWPSCRYDDYAALTRLVEALAEYCDKVLVDGVDIKSSSLLSVGDKVWYKPTQEWLIVKDVDPADRHQTYRCCHLDGTSKLWRSNSDLDFTKSYSPCEEGSKTSEIGVSELNFVSIVPKSQIKLTFL